MVDEAGTEADTHTYVYLSDVPMDARKVAAAFHASSAAEQQLGDGSAGYVRVCINAEGGECGLYFSHNNPSASFNFSGYGTVKLDAAPPGASPGVGRLRSLAISSAKPTTSNCASIPPSRRRPARRCRES